MTRRPTYVESLPGLTETDIAALHGAGIGTLEALLERVAQVGLDAAVEKTGVAPGVLRPALVAHALREAEGGFHPPRRRALAFARANWMEGLIAVGVLLLAAGALRALGRPERQVVTTESLQPFQVIRAGQVAVERTNADFGAYRSDGDVEGRFPLRAVAGGEALRRDQLSRIRFPDPRELEGRRILSLAVAPHTVPLAVPGTRVTLLLSPRDPGRGAAGEVNGAIVLDARGAGDSASVVVAVRDEDVPTLARSLAGAQVFVLQHVAAPAPR